MAAEGTVAGYHGCELEIARRLLLGLADLTPSRNPYDWLGRGAYAWEQNGLRAFE